MRIQSWTGWKARLALLAVLPLLGAPSCQQTRQAADVNLDGWVDAHDLERMDACIGQLPGAVPACGKADVQGDGDIDAWDRDIVQRHQGVRLFTPIAAPYMVGSILIDPNGVLYLHAPQQHAIHRWSVTDAKPLSSLSLGPSSIDVTYSSADHRLYVAHEPNYTPGWITRIEAGLPVGEVTFVASVSHPRRLAMAGSYLVSAVADMQQNPFVYAPSGAQVSAGAWNSTGSSYVWSPQQQRLYYMSAFSLYWHAINAATGVLGVTNHAFTQADDFSQAAPVRLSADGTRILFGSGDLMNTASLQPSGFLPYPPADALWLGDGSVVTLRDIGDGRTRLHHWNAALALTNYQDFAGTPLRVLAAPGGVVAVVTDVDGVPQVATYVPTDDADGDGVATMADAFPHDPAASQDTDGDGAPDVWNPGQDAEQSDGLELDAFPLDSACQLAEHALPGQPGVCDTAHDMPAFEPHDVLLDDQGIAYLLSAERDRVYRWSLLEERYLNPIALGNPIAVEPPRLMAWSAVNGRMYFGYDEGIVSQVDVAAALPQEAPFTLVSSSIWSLQTAGAYVFTDGTGFQTYDAGGARVSKSIEISALVQLEWSPANERMYYVRSGSPPDVEWLEIDASTGEIGASHDSPYHGDFPIEDPLRVSPDGTRVLTGTGDLFDGATLARSGWIGGWMRDAAWTENGGVLALRPDGSGGSLLETWDDALVLQDVSPAAGEPLRILRFGGEAFVLTLVDGHPTFLRGVPGTDLDGDGVPYALDAFPFDPAASQDSDRDGYADAWNPGYGPDDSTTGLVLDAFPLDPACQLEEHGADGVCDSIAVLPTAPGQAFCDSDELLSEDANGARYAPRADDFEPLCSGWLLLGDRIESRIAVHNVVNGRSAARFPLPAAPGELELDEANQQLYVAFPEHYALGRLDLLTGAVETIQLAEPATSLSLGPDGGLLVATAPNANQRLLHWLPAGASAVTGEWPILGSQLRWNPAHDELLVGQGEGADYQARLARYDFEPASGPSLIESRRAGTYGRRLALSPDGEHLAYAAVGGNGPEHEEPFDQGIFDFVANDLASHRGAFAIVEPQNAAFAPDGVRLLAASRHEAVIFGVGDFAPQLVHELAGAAGSNVQSLGWSRGGSLAFVRERFSFPQNRDYYRWIVSPGP